MRAFFVLMPRRAEDMTFITIHKTNYTIDTLVAYRDQTDYAVDPSGAPLAYRVLVSFGGDALTETLFGAEAQEFLDYVPLECSPEFGPPAMRVH